MQLTTSLAHRAKRARVQADIEAFLAGGGRIRQFPPRATAERPAPFGRSKVPTKKDKRGS